MLLRLCMMLSFALALSGASPVGARAAEPASPDAQALRDGAPGVVTLSSPRYRVLKSGPPTGDHPRRKDEIVVNYEGAFTNGKIFDQAQAAHFKLGQLIAGWVAVVPLMRPGDQWEVYLPAYLAYGEKGHPPDPKDPTDTGIPPNADLIFRIELLSIDPAP
jgi:FKBP-type peptidyl-prolyl cis-trans isomerase